MRKKALSIAFNTIVVALIALAILAFVMLAFSKYLGKGTQGYDQQISSVNEAANSSMLYQKCYTYLLVCNKEAFNENQCGTTFPDLKEQWDARCGE